MVPLVWYNGLFMVWGATGISWADLMHWLQDHKWVEPPPAGGGAQPFWKVRKILHHTYMHAGFHRITCTLLRRATQFGSQCYVISLLNVYVIFRAGIRAVQSCAVLVVGGGMGGPHKTNTDSISCMCCLFAGHQYGCDGCASRGALGVG